MLQVIATRTLWKSPKSNNPSKILIQGGKQSLNTIFVFNELPKIDQKVKDRRTQKPSFISITQDLSCKKCEYTTKLETDLKTHITTIHTNKSPQNRDTVEVVDRTNLETHITTYHTDKPPEKPDTEEVVDVFHCFQCNATFYDRRISDMRKRELLVWGTENIFNFLEICSYLMRTSHHMELRYLQD